MVATPRWEHEYATVAWTPVPDSLGSTHNRPLAATVTLARRRQTLPLAKLGAREPLAISIVEGKNVWSVFVRRPREDPEAG